tara:strand:+ start:1276 stop:2487 length:1212 start_codon:yes stop_codon:yes gene_type:complete
MLLASALVEVILASLVALPLLLYRLKAKRWQRIELEYPTNPHDAELVILLPIWNEAIVIEKKLDDLKRQYPCQTSLLVIDSASTDDSVDKVKRWLNDNSSAFFSSQVIEMPKRLGKTSAVKQAIEYLDNNSYEGLVLMTDADALIGQGTITRLYGWFANPSIGVVGSSANRLTSLSGEAEYRSLYQMLRSAESKIDSTPFLEGSCMMWRHGSFSASNLNTNANADDAQIASLVRFGGLKSIFDGEANFTDFAPPTIDGQRRQKIRRAQGLQQMLDKLAKQHKLPKDDEFSKIFKTQRFLHLAAPLILFQVAISAVVRWIFVSISGMPTGYEAIIHAVLAFIELMILVSWLTYRNGIKLPLVGTIGSIVTSFEYLFIARYRNSRAIQSHMWEQHSDVRKLMDRF